MRFAGTWKQYSTKAISQLTTMAATSGDRRYLRWPYQAMVIKILEQIRSRTVFIRNESYHHSRVRAARVVAQVADASGVFVATPEAFDASDPRPLDRKTSGLGAHKSRPRPALQNFSLEVESHVRCRCTSKQQAELGLSPRLTLIRTNKI